MRPQLNPYFTLAAAFLMITASPLRAFAQSRGTPARPSRPQPTQRTPQPPAEPLGEFAESENEAPILTDEEIEQMAAFIKASTNAPKQQDILKDAALKNVLSLPKEAADFTLSTFGLADYDLLVNEHERFKAGQKAQSPFNVFAANLPRFLTPKPVNTWNLTNHDPAMASLINEQWGLCAGLTFVLRRMQLLAHFQPSARLGIDKTKNPEAWLTEMKERLDRIVLEKKPTIIPEFKSLSHLTQNDLLKLYLKKLVIREWAMRSASLGALKQLLQTQTKFTAEDAKRIYQDIDFRLNELKYPPVVSAAMPYNKEHPGWWIHVLTVIGLEGDPTTEFKIKVWDVNYSDAEEVIREITVSKQGGGPNAPWKAAFDGLAGLSDVMLHPHDDLEITDMVKNSLDFCAKNRPLCTRVKP